MIEPHLITYKYKNDNRGSFSKLDFLHEKKIEFNFASLEIFWTISSINVVRGIHFQIPPFDHNKIVICLHGDIFDVVVDLRNTQKFGSAQTFNLKSSSNQALYIPKGHGHGFQALCDNSLVLYLVDLPHSPQHDRGIHWQSVDVKWPLTNAIISSRDKSHEVLDDFDRSTFIT